MLVALCVAAASPLAAQEWSGSVGGAYLWQNVDGSEDSFRSQMNLEEGFLLEDLNLLFHGDGAVSDDLVGVRCIASGWGQESFGGDLTRNLREVGG